MVSRTDGLTQGFAIYFDQFILVNLFWSIYFDQNRLQALLLGLQNPRVARLGWGHAWYLATSAQFPESRNFLRRAQMDWARGPLKGLAGPLFSGQPGRGRFNFCGSSGPSLTYPLFS
jgi:hypothetical protein